MEDLSKQISPPGVELCLRVDGSTLEHVYDINKDGSLFVHGRWTKFDAGLHSTRRLATYRGTSLTRTRTPLGPCRKPLPRVLGGSKGGWRFLMREVPLHRKGG